MQLWVVIDWCTERPAQQIRDMRWDVKEFKHQIFCKCFHYQNVQCQLHPAWTAMASRVCFLYNTVVITKIKMFCDGGCRWGQVQLLASLYQEDMKMEIDRSYLWMFKLKRNIYFPLWRLFYNKKFYIFWRYSFDLFLKVSIEFPLESLINDEVPLTVVQKGLQVVLRKVRLNVPLGVHLKNSLKMSLDVPF